MTTESKKCILFDADGVVINKPHLFSEVYSKEHNIPYSSLLEFFTGPFQDCLVGTRDLKIELVPYLKQWNWQGSIDEFLQYWFETEAHVNEQMIEYIGELRARGVICCMGTNNEKYRVAYLAGELGFASVFDKLFGSGTVGHKKPETAFYTTVLENIKNEFGITKENVIFFDDDRENIDGAHEVNLQASL